MNYVSSGYVRSGYVIEDSDTIDGITFDKHGLFIEVSSSITSIDVATIRSRHVDWLDVEENDKMRKGMRYSGFDLIPTGFTGATFFMINGWRLVYNPSTTAISGVLYSEDYDTAYWTRTNDIWSPLHPITVSAVVNTVVVTEASSDVNIISVNDVPVTSVDDFKADTITTDAPTVQEIAKEVWTTALPYVSTEWLDELGDVWRDENDERWDSE